MELSERDLLGEDVFQVTFSPMLLCLLDDFCEQTKGRHRDIFYHMLTMRFY